MPGDIITSVLDCEEIPATPTQLRGICVGNTEQLFAILSDPAKAIELAEVMAREGFFILETKAHS